MTFDDARIGDSVLYKRGSDNLLHGKSGVIVSKMVPHILIVKFDNQDVKKCLPFNLDVK